MYTIDKLNRKIIITVQKDGVSTFSNYSEKIEINEFDKLEKKFLPNTQDKFECELILLDVEKRDESGNKTGIMETKAFARRIGREDWLMEFNESDYVL